MFHAKFDRITSTCFVVAWSPLRVAISPSKALISATSSLTADFSSLFDYTWVTLTFPFGPSPNLSLRSDSSVTAILSSFINSVSVTLGC